MNKYVKKYKNIIDRGEKLTYMDTIDVGKEGSKYHDSRHVGINRKYNQKEKYDAEPSKKSLENKKPGKYDLKV